MRFALIIFVLTILCGCEKIDNDSMKLIGGNWKCDGILIDGNQLIPYDDGILRVSQNKVEFTFGSRTNRLRVQRIVRYEDQNALIFDLTLRSVKGQKMQQQLRLSEGKLYGLFYSTNGFVTKEDWELFSLIYENAVTCEHRFTKLN
jgi:hypothetical protein